ncbi:unnamed protein product [Amoebophrya sp. A120]|nr:unnamed protein product [Amoebophrya sp. A120]|eukprot:GSA120T00004240001.1
MEKYYANEQIGQSSSSCARDLNNDLNDNMGTTSQPGFLQRIIGKCLHSRQYLPLGHDAEQQRGGDGDVSAGHVGRYISLANNDRASKFACHVPAIITFSSTALFLFALFYSQVMFIHLTLFMGAWMFGWVSYMGICSYFGVKKMRYECSQDWGKQWEDYLARNPGCDEGLLHFVILPNYDEEEEMMSQTINNVANNKLAKKYMVVVLAMEAREGEAGQQKANNLIQRHQHLFKAMFATYHPASIPGEVKGKSSNTQWAYREVQRWYGAHVSREGGEQDASKVFLTVADADSIHHKEYFANLTLKAMPLSREERTWTMWQPPILNWRNWETVPGPVRTSSYGTFLFEVSGLVSSPVIDHLVFSTYTLTLALANHPIVDGWDADVIAEDHHMYMKCLCACHWESLLSNESNRSVKGISKLKIEALYTPVTSYLVEDSRGCLHNIYSRYKQARRHMQGISELAYLLLQHYSIATTSRESMPWPAHLQMLNLVVKYCTVSILNCVHTLVLHLFAVTFAIWMVAALYQGTLFETLEQLNQIRLESTLVNFLCLFLQFSTPIFGAVIVGANWMGVKDSLEGLYCPLYFLSTKTSTRDELYQDMQYGVATPDRNGNLVSVEPLPMGTDLKMMKKKGLQIVPLQRKLTYWGQLKTFVQVYTDINVIGQPTLLLYGTIPLFQTAISLSQYGHKFDYIVAAKPEARKIESATTSSGSASSSEECDNVV